MVGEKKNRKKKKNGMKTRAIRTQNNCRFTAAEPYIIIPGYIMITINVILILTPILIARADTFAVYYRHHTLYNNNNITR